MRSTLAILVAGIFWQAALGSANWPNEPATATQLFDCGFDQQFVQDARNPNYFATCDGKLTDPYGTIRSTLSKQQDLTAPLSPSAVIRSSLFYPSKSGGTQLEYRDPTNSTEVFVGLWWKPSDPFDGNFIGHNKLFFVRGGDNQNGVFMWQKTYKGTSTSRLYWTTQLTYNLDQCGGTDIDQCFANVSDVHIVPGTWYRIEFYIKASSCPTCHDGIVRWWITPKGGATVLAGNYKNFAYGPLVNEWVWAETWDNGGNGTGFSTDVYHQLDHLHISQSHGAADPVVPISISTGSLPAARLGVAYSATLQAANGKAPYGWTITSGSLLPGLSLNKTTGVISGTPTACGRSNFTVKVMDSSVPAGEATKSFYIIANGTNCPSSIGEVTSTPTTKNAQLQITAHSGKAHFDIPIAAGEYRLSVYDFAGEKVFEHRSMGQKETSLATSLKSGVYLARFARGTQSSTFRFHVIN